MFKKINSLWISFSLFSLIHLSSFVYANECNIADFVDLKDDGYEILVISATTPVEPVNIDDWGYVNVFSSEICSISDNNQLRVDATIHMSTGFDKKITLYYQSNMTPRIEDVSSQGSFFVGQMHFNIEAGGPFIVAYKLSEK